MSQRTIASTLAPSCPHPMGEAVPITHARSTAEKLAITGYALRHAPAEPTGPSPHTWLRAFDRNGGKIPAADWRTRISARPMGVAA
jgi:hypothetical protein